MPHFVKAAPTDIGKHQFLDREFFRHFDPLFSIKLAAKIGKNSPSVHVESGDGHDINSELKSIIDELRVDNKSENAGILYFIRHLAAETFFGFLLSGYPFISYLEFQRKVRSGLFVKFVHEISEGCIPKEYQMGDLTFEVWVERRVFSTDSFDKAYISDLAKFIIREAVVVLDRSPINAFKHGLRSNFGGFQLTLGGENDEKTSLINAETAIGWTELVSDSDGLVLKNGALSIDVEACSRVIFSMCALMNCIKAIRTRDTSVENVEVKLTLLPGLFIEPTAERFEMRRKL